MKTFQTSFHPGAFSMLMSDLLWVDLPGFVDLFEKQQSSIFRFPEKQQLLKVFNSRCE